jgi:nucleoside-diphosphate-sugar epimerase
VRILVTGSDGYIGAILAPYLARAGHEVVGLDSLLFADCTFGPEPERVETLVKDIRDVRPEDLDGFDAVVHLAAISKVLAERDIAELVRKVVPGSEVTFHRRDRP